MRIKLALVLKPLIAARAKKNLSAGGGDRKSPFQKSGKAVDSKTHTDRELAKLAGVSHDTLAKAASAGPGGAGWGPAGDGGYPQSGAWLAPAAPALHPSKRPPAGLAEGRHKSFVIRYL